MRTFLLCVLLIALAAVLYLFRPFLLNIAIAALMAVATANLNALLARKISARALRSALLAAGMALLFLGPFAYAALAISKALANVDFAWLQGVLRKLSAINLPAPLETLRPQIDEFLAAPDLAAIAKNALNYASNFSSRGLKFFTDLILIIIFYFFANYYAAPLLGFFRALLPLRSEQWKSLLGGLSSVMSVVFYSVIATAVFEGFLFAIIAGIYGYDALFCGICYAFCSLIPVIGGAIMWLPLAALTYAAGDAAGAIVIAAYSVVVISGIADTLIKPLIIRLICERWLRVKTTLGELLIFFAMLAGIGSFGFWGVIIGPAVLAFFMGAAQLFTSQKAFEG